MSEPTGCRWVSSTRPRIVPRRHVEDCHSDACRGCQPCTEPHCRVCGITHSEGACAECLAEARENLHEIARMCGSLPEEVRHRGIDGEAMMLLGPSADPEAWGHREASARAGRISADYLADARDESHPVYVLGGWEMIYRDAFEHDDASGPALSATVAYLDNNLTYAATWPHVPFEDLARDLRRVTSHLASVLHDGEQIDEGVPCLTCGRPLRRTWGDGHREDGWECKRCRTTSTEAQYRFAVKADYIAAAEWLTAEDMATRTGVAASTVRSWASERGDRAAVVRKRLDSERTVYAVEDVVLARDDRAA